MKAENSKNMLAVPLDPEYAALFALVTDRYLRFHLRRFFSFCSWRGIAPSAVSAADLIAFGEVVAAAGVDRPRQVMRDAGKAWNRMVAAQGDWPQTILDAPYSERHKRRSMTFADFPPSLVLISTES